MPVIRMRRPGTGYERFAPGFFDAGAFLAAGLRFPSRASTRFVSRRISARSEEHTSELQSRQYLVCRLLLEKKKKIKLVINTYHAKHKYNNLKSTYNTIWSHTNGTESMYTPIMRQRMHNECAAHRD